MKPSRRQRRRLVQAGSVALALCIALAPGLALLASGRLEDQGEATEMLLYPDLATQVLEALPETAGETVENPAVTEDPLPKPPPPSEWFLPVENIYQNPELPNGCEVTSLAIVLAWWDLPVDKTVLAEDYLPTQEFLWEDWQHTGGNPEEVYPGNPADSTGYYCFPGVLVQTARRYLANKTSSLRVKDITGATEEELMEHIHRGCPVIFWRTLEFDAPRTREDLAWTLADSGETYEPYVNLHVAVLSGYDTDNFYMCDPLGPSDSVARDVLMENFETMGSRAVVILPARRQ